VLSWLIAFPCLVSAQADPKLPPLSPDEKKAIDQFADWTVPRLINRCLSQDQGVDAYHARQAILRCGSKAIGPVTKAFLDGSDADRPPLILLLGEMYREGDVLLEDLFCHALKNGSDDLKNHARSAVSAFVRVRKAIPVLNSIIDDPSESSRNRSGAASSLGRFGQEAEHALPLLLRWLRDRRTNREFRTGLVVGVGGIGTKSDEVAGLLQRIMADKNEDKWTRAYAAGGIGHSKFGQRAVPDLIAILRSDSNEPFELRVSTIYPLSQLNPTKAAIEPIVGILDDEKLGAIHPMALSVLAKIGPDAADALPAILKTIEDRHLIYEPDFCVHVLGRILGPNQAFREIERIANVELQNDQGQLDLYLKSCKKELQKLDKQP
jgi:hypothetical protein